MDCVRVSSACFLLKQPCLRHPRIAEGEAEASQKNSELLPGDDENNGFGGALHPPPSHCAPGRVLTL